MITYNHKHVSSSLMKDAYIWQVGGIKRHAWWMTIIHRGLQWYMLATYGGGRDNDTCSITVNHNHASCVYDGTFLHIEVGGIMIHSQSLSIISMYHNLWWYMLTYRGGKDKDTCLMTVNHNHPSCVYDDTLLHIEVGGIMILA